MSAASRDGQQNSSRGILQGVIDQSRKTLLQTISIGLNHWDLRRWPQCQPQPIRHQSLQALKGIQQQQFRIQSLQLKL